MEKTWRSSAEVVEVERELAGVELLRAVRLLYD
jgi:hypothetical protein